MQRDEEELPPNELDLPQSDSPQPESEFEELADLPPDGAVNSGEAEAMDVETDAPGATDLDDADGMAVIRAIEDSLASTEGESPVSNAVPPLPSPSTGDMPEVIAPEESAVSLDAEGSSGAAAPTLLPVNWSPFMKLVLGNTPPPRATEEGDVEQPWSSVQPPAAAETAEAARHSPLLAIERKKVAGTAISVFVQVHLTDDAIRRVAEMTVREEASKSQHQTEVVAKRVFDIELGLFRLEAERRQLWR